MNDYLARFSESPASFKKSFALLVAAYVSHPIFIQSLFWAREPVAGSERDLMKMAVVSLSLILILFLIKKWARALVVVGNVFIVINDCFYLVVMPPNKLSSVLCAVVVVCTILGTYWLFVKDTRDYYSEVNS